MRQRGQILIYGIIALAVLAMLTGIAYKIRESGKDAIRIEWDAAKQAQREKEAKQADNAVKGKEKGDAKARVVYKTITAEVEKIVTRDVYRNVCLDDDGLRAAGNAIRGPDAPAVKPSPTVPAPAKPGGRDGKVGLAMDRDG